MLKNNPLMLLMKALGKIRYLKEARNVRSLWISYYFIKRYLKWKDNDRFVAEGTNENVRINKTIWIYWKQGLDNAPDLVKKCVASVYKHAGDYDIVVLDENNLSQYIELPIFINEKHQKGLIREALFSDLLRISLIIRYGGIWCDATCFWTNSIPQNIEITHFFMFSESLMMSNITPIVGSNWFLKGCKDDVILSKTRNCLFNYWAKHDNLPNYFIFHLMLSALVKTDPECAEEWKKIPYICNINPHVLQFHFSSEYDESLYVSYKKSCFIHKLTYKYDKKLLMDNYETVLQHFLNNE